MTPWLLLIIAALIVMSVSLYSHARQVESQTLGRQLVVADELREAEAVLHAALEKLRQMDTVLAVRERQLASGGLPLPMGNGAASARASWPEQTERLPGSSPPPAGGETNRVPVAPVEADPAPVGSDRKAAFPSGTFHTQVDKAGVIAASEAEPSSIGRPPRRKTTEASMQHWQTRVIELAGIGMEAVQIARELELPVGEVELVLALRPSRSPLL